MGPSADCWAFWKFSLKCSLNRTVCSCFALIRRKLLRKMHNSFSFHHKLLSLIYLSFTYNSLKCFSRDSLKLEWNIPLALSSGLYGHHWFSGAQVAVDESGKSWVRTEGESSEQRCAAQRADPQQGGESTWMDSWSQGQDFLRWEKLKSPWKHCFLHLQIC